MEGADQRILLHLYHAKQTQNRTNALILATDTDIAVKSIAALAEEVAGCRVWQSINN